MQAHHEFAAPRRRPPRKRKRRPSGEQGAGTQPTGPMGAGDLRALLRGWRERLTSEPLRTPLALFFGSRIALFLFVAFFTGLFPVAADQKPSFLNAFSRWDGGWYVSIARDGYQWKGLATQSNVAFFPLYPLLGKVTSFFVLGNVQLALFLVSNVAFAFALYYLYRLTEHEFDSGTAGRAVLYLAAFPLAFIFSCLYSESLFIALVAAALFYARAERWRPAIALATLATLTRSAGLALLPALAYEYWRQKEGRLDRKAAALAIIPLGTASYMAYLWSLTGTPLAFIAVQRSWDRQSVYPWGMLRIGWQLLTTQPLTRYITAIAIVDVFAVIGTLLLLILAWRRLPAMYWIYGLLVFLVSTSTALDPSKGLPTASVARYLMSIVPAFIILAYLGRRRYVHYALLFIFLILQGPLALYFFSNVWVT